MLEYISAPEAAKKWGMKKLQKLIEYGKNYTEYKPIYICFI